MTRPRVLLLVIDALAPRWVRPDVMPALSAWAAAGASRPDGGLAVMPASTYPNHCTFVTGVPPVAHGLFAATTLAPDGSPVAAWELGPRVPTLFDRCAAADLEAVAVLGDQHLVGAMGAQSAAACWPEGGALPDVATDDFGYAADVEVGPRIAEAVRGGPDLLVAQLNGPDTAAHLDGPDSEEARTVYRATDEALWLVAEALSPAWSEWLVLVVSDHSQEEAVPDAFVDVTAAAAAAGVHVEVIEDGSAVVVAGPGTADASWLGAVEGVRGVEALAPGVLVAWGEPGVPFARGPWPVRGIHGGPGTRPQVAVVSGGHGSARALGAALSAAPPPATAWAGWVGDVLGLAAGP